jgi:formamidopyrimidine-DNA glycosylase
MTGRLRVVSASEPREPHTHVVWTLDRDRELRFADARRFGQVKVVLRSEENDLPDLGQLGVDPLSRAMTTDALLALTRASRRPVKTFLLDQTRIAGIGNIYACEALYRACIHPAVPANRLTRERVERLRNAIVEVLRTGLRNRGTTLRDYVDADGERGRNQHALDVYGREGKACRRCGRTVKRLTHEARGTFFCPGCQKR